MPHAVQRFAINPCCMVNVEIGNLPPSLGRQPIMQFKIITTFIPHIGSERLP